MRALSVTLLGALLTFTATLCAVAQVPQPEQQVVNARLPRERIEFPLRLKHTITAGRTPVGSPVEATLVMATLVHGVVIPENAVFKGVLEESVKREDKSASRVKVHIVSAKWNGKRIAVDLYATGHIYLPFKPKPDPDQIRRRRALMTLGVIPTEESVSPSAPRYNSRQLIDKHVHNERSATGEVVVISDKSNIEMSGGAVYCFEGSAAR